MRKLLALLLALLMVAGTVMMIACGDEKDPEEGKKDPVVDPVDPGTDPVDPGTDPVDPGTDPVDPGTDPERKYLDNLPEKMDFGGEEMRFVMRDSNILIEEPDKMNDGDAVAKAVYDRQTEIEDRFNVIFGGNTADMAAHTWGDARDEIDRSVTAGTDEYDLGSVHMKFGAALATQGKLRNMNKLTNIDFTQDYWNHVFTDNFTYKTTQYWATGDIVTGYLYELVGMYVDDTLWETSTGSSIDELFKVVFAGEWTLDKLFEYTQNVYEDTNNNGTRDLGDTFGWVYASTEWVQSAVMICAGYNYSVKSGSKYELDLASAEDELIYTAVKHVMFPRENTYVLPCSDPTNEFVNGRALFFHQTLDKLVSSDFRSRETPWSVVPMPKYSVEDQYRASCYDGISIVGVPATLPYERYEMVGAIVEALAGAGQKYVTEAVFETAFKAKAARNEGSFKALDIIRENGYADFAFCWCGPLGEIDKFTANAIGGGVGSLATAAASTQAGYQKKLDNLYQNLAKLEKADKAQQE